MIAHDSPHDDIALDISCDDEIVLGVCLNDTHSVLMLVVCLNDCIWIRVYEEYLTIDNASQHNVMPRIYELNGKRFNLKGWIKELVIVYFCQPLHLLLLLNWALEGSLCVPMMIAIPFVEKHFSTSSHEHQGMLLEPFHVNDWLINLSERIQLSFLLQ